VVLKKVFVFVSVLKMHKDILETVKDEYIS